jgi:sugar phosphate isomerase/epimerase
MSLARFSFNQATANNWPLAELVAGCVAAGVTSVGLWRAPVVEYGLGETAKLLRDNGLSVSTLCRGGFFNADDWLDDNRRAVDEAAALGAPVLVLVCGGLGSRTLDAARAHVAAAIEELVPHAVDAGVRLAIEPMHPMYCADRGVVSTLAGALALAERFPASAVGVAIDTYHVWWDERVWDVIAAAGAAGRIATFQVADWLTPLPAGVLLGRGLPGSGCVEIGRFTASVDAAGYTGPIEVEVFNAELWARPGPEILADTVESYLRHVQPSTQP